MTRNDSSIIVFKLANDLAENGIRMVGAHTDSPCLKVKPNPEISSKGYLQLGVEVYGGALLNPWFDRDLSLAGRVSYSDRNDGVHSALVDFEQAIAVIPSLAIHLDREVNENTLTYYIQKFSDDELMGLIRKRMLDEDLENLFNTLAGLLRKYLSDEEYHRVFLKDRG